MRAGQARGTDDRLPFIPADAAFDARRAAQAICRSADRVRGEAPRLDARELARVSGHRLEVVLAVSLQLLRLEAAFGVHGENLLVAAEIRRRQIANQVEQAEPLLRIEAF